MDVSPEALGELKLALTSSLERKGVLAKVKAQLRAHVFEAVRDQGGVAPPGASRPFRDRVPRGALLASLVHEYLEWAGLDYSRRVFAAESGEPEDETSAARRGRLADAFGVAGDATDDVPILAALLAKTTNRAPAGVFAAEGLRTEPEPEPATADPATADPAPPSPPVIARASAAPARPSSARGGARGGRGATTTGASSSSLPPLGLGTRQTLPPSANVMMSDDDDDSAEIEIETDYATETDAETDPDPGGRRSASPLTPRGEEERERSAFEGDDRSGSIEGLDDTVDVVESAS